MYRDTLRLQQDVLGLAHPGTLTTQLNLIGTIAAEGHIRTAAALLARMESLLLTWLGTELHSTGEARARRELVAAQSTYQDMALSLALLPNAGRDEAELAASALLRFKSLAVEEEAYLARLTRHSADTRIRDVASEIARLHHQLAQRFWGDGKQAKEAAALAAQLDAKELELGRISRGYTAYLQVRNVSLQELWANLPPRSAVLELRLYRPIDFRSRNRSMPRWAGVLISKDREIKVRDLGPVDSTTEPIYTVLASVPMAETSERALYQQLLAPFEPGLSGLQRLYISPDGLLYLLPFGLLRNEDSHRLLETLEVRYVQSGRDLLRPAPDHPGNGLIAVGGIDFGAALSGQALATPSRSDSDDALLTLSREKLSDTVGREFPSLPYSEKEVDEIGRLYRHSRQDETVTIVVGANPTKSWLFGLAPPRVLHLATHGFYLEAQEPTEHPMLLAGVALAGANIDLQQHSEGGILYALEAQDLNLDGTELVVLSACDTSRGQIDYGDGVSGLVRALRTAGARSVLVALRPVSDQRTAEFMQLFYAHWLRQTHSDPAAALRDAQLEQVRTSQDDTWTSFILIGS